MDRLGIVLLSAVLLSACASQIPEQTRSAPSRGSPAEADARSGTQRFSGARIRWGGTIATVDNRESQTWIEVARCHLRNNGKPGQSHGSQGPFMARLEGDLDPAIYAKGRRLTVVGNLENRNSGTVDAYAQQPVVNVETHHLWASLPEGRGARATSRGAYSHMPVPYGPLLFDFFF